jgi:Protein of unknown function (DUF3311)
MSEDRNGSSGGQSWVYWLLIIPFIATLWVPFYNSIEPTWQGIPYFFWYQFLWIILGAGITAIVYFLTERQ